MLADVHLAPNPLPVLSSSTTFRQAGHTLASCEVCPLEVVRSHRWGAGYGIHTHREMPFGQGDSRQPRANRKALPWLTSSPLVESGDACLPACDFCGFWAPSSSSEQKRWPPALRKGHPLTKISSRITCWSTPFLHNPTSTSHLNENSSFLHAFTHKNTEYFLCFEVTRSHSGGQTTVYPSLLAESPVVSQPELTSLDEFS